MAMSLRFLIYFKVAVLAVFLFYFFISTPSEEIIFRGYPDSKYEQLPVLTLEQLSSFNGIDNPKIFTSIKNLVFDVTDSGFYDQQSGYFSFAGNDATLMIAKWEAVPELANLYNTQKYDQLTDAQKKDVDVMFEGTYLKKYPVVARIWFNHLTPIIGQTHFHSEL